MPTLNWYQIFRNILVGPLLRVWNRPTAEGLHNIPTEGAAILASNHQSVFDSFYLCLLCPRQITFLSKKEYFTGTGVIGALQRWFFTAAGQVPIDRTSGDAAQDALNAGVKVLSAGNLLGIYPEGTRSPDGRLYRGKTGMARVALETNTPIVPIVMLGTRRANPIGSWFVRPTKVGMIVGEPLDPMAVIAEHNVGDDPSSYEAVRALTDEVIARLKQLSGQEYVDCYAHDVKASLAAGNGYPPGTAPTHH